MAERKTIHTITFTPQFRKKLVNSTRELLRSMEESTFYSPRAKKTLLEQGREYLRSLEEPESTKPKAKTAMKRKA